jgi:hypothetical protein
VHRRRVTVLVVCSLSTVAMLQGAFPGAAVSRSPHVPRRIAPMRRVVADRAERPAADGLTRALTEGRIDRATYALERARALFHLDAVREAFGDVVAPGPRDATLVLRDLVAVHDRLSPSERVLADRILARPTDGSSDPQGDGYAVAEATPYCTANACFHWVASTEDAPSPSDADIDGVPDWVETTATEFDTVWNTEITTLGFRPPKPDLTSTNHGPSGGIDIYLAQIGDDGLYGYCTTDDPNVDPATGYRYWDMSAFCVVDNDFAELGGLPAMQVTLAHEFFHAVQFAYDIGEDVWFMESTATWIEDEVFDDSNDNVNYLDVSPIGKPRTPLDSNNTAFGVYGDWIFFRFVSELFATAGVHDTGVVRHAWNLADGSPTAPNRYSLQAVAAALKAAGLPFRELFAKFGMVNDVAPAWYEEGIDNAYPLPPLADKVVVTTRNDTFVDAYRTKHLTDTYVEFVPRRGVATSAKLLVVVDLPAYRTGPEASVVTITKTGEVVFRRISLTAGGDAKLRVAFGRGTVAAVDLVLTNASTRTKCWVDPNGRFSCYGDPKDDGAVYRFGVRLIQ